MANMADIIFGHARIFESLPPIKLTPKKQYGFPLPSLTLAKDHTPPPFFLNPLLQDPLNDTVVEQLKSGENPLVVHLFRW